MSCGSIVYFSGGQVGFVRMEFEAKCITNFTHANRNWGIYVLQKFIIEAILKCLCPAKIQDANEFLEKKIGHVCPAKIDF
jgi:hypothetical protein